MDSSLPTLPKVRSTLYSTASEYIIHNNSLSELPLVKAAAFGMCSDE